MTEEEKKAIGQLIWYKQLFNNGYCKDCNELCSSGASVPSEDLANSIETLLNLIQRQDRQIQKLKNKNKDLHSTYKKEFYRLNIILEQRDRQIDLMAEMLNKLLNNIDFEKEIINKENNADCIKQYFAEQAKEVE